MGVSGWGCQGGCERRSFVKIKKKMTGEGGLVGGGGGVRADVNVFVKIQEKKNRGEGVRVDVNGEFFFFFWGGGGG